MRGACLRDSWQSDPAGNPHLIRCRCRKETGSPDTPRSTRRDTLVGNRLVLGLTAALALVAAAACGGSDDDKDSGGTQNTTQATTAADAPSGTQAAAATSVATQAAAAPSTAPQTVTIKAGEYFYDPKDILVRPGRVAVTMTNEGPERPHTFTVKNKSGSGDLFRSDRISQGQATTLEFEVMEEGTYEVYCNLPGHADRGQRGTLTVSRS
jgi:plastocyanin